MVGLKELNGISTLIKSFLFLNAILITLAACATQPRQLTEQGLADKYQDFMHSYQNDIDASAAKTVQRLEQEYRHGWFSADSEGQSYDMLILSGGGASGAFGTGFLKGWGKVSAVDYTRPEFDYVSGISTGALIASYAFVGTDKAYDEVINLYQGLRHDSARKRSFFSYLPNQTSLYDVSKLHGQIRSAISPELIGSIKRGAEQGRQLLIGATNLDYALLRVWDLAKISSEMPTVAAMEKIVSLLLAATALPVMFPPVLIDDHLYVDGGVVMQIVSGINERGWAYQTDNQVMSYVDPKRPIKVRVWVVVNDKLLLDPSMTPLRWPSVLERTLKTSIKSAALQNIQDAETFVRLINERPEFDAQLRYVSIPQSFAMRDTVEIFNPENIQNLIELGLKMGENPNSWKTHALRPGAPFKLKEDNH